MKPRPLIPTVPALLALASYTPAHDKQPAGAEKAAHAQVDACDAKALCRRMHAENTQ
jgi:hypothetical protein